MSADKGNDMSQTPRTDAAREVYDRWHKYAQEYGHIPDAMAGAPKYADPFEIAEELECELAQARADAAQGERRGIERAIAAISNIALNCRLVGTYKYEVLRALRALLEGK